MKLIIMKSLMKQEKQQQQKIELFRRMKCDTRTMLIQYSRGILDDHFS